jgi:hypothetical protein
MLLAIWLMLCLVVAAVGLRRPTVAVLAVICVAIFVPYVATESVVGEVQPQLHPASWLVLTVFALVLLTRPTRILGELARHPLIYLAGMIGIVGISISTFGIGGGYGIGLVIDQIAAPALLLLLTGMLLNEEPRRFFMIRNVLLGLAVIQVLIALVGWFLGTQLFFVEYYESQYWFDPLTNTRALGTVDDPLTLSLFLSACVPLCATLSRTTMQLALVGLLMVGVLLTQSRTGLVVAAAGVAYLLLRRDVGLGARIMVIVGTAALAVVLVASDIAAPVLSRIANDGGSASARAQSFGVFWRNAREFLILGNGATSSYDFGKSLGLGTSFENAFFMYSVDFGLIFASFYFGALTLAALQGLRKGHFPGAAMAALVAVGVCLTFSSVAGNNAGGMIIWLLTALAFARFEEPASRTDSPRQRESTLRSCPQSLSPHAN